MIVVLIERHSTIPCLWVQFFPRFLKITRETLNIIGVQMHENYGCIRKSPLCLQHIIEKQTSEQRKIKHKRSSKCICSAFSYLIYSLLCTEFCNSWDFRKGASVSHAGHFRLLCFSFNVILPFPNSWKLAATSPGCSAFCVFHLLT